MAYTTKQHQAILRLLEQRREEALTAAELAEYLRREGFPVGLATIYRQLEKLESGGMIHKINTESGAYYQYCPRTEDHRDCILLQCRRCGRIVHLDCGQLQGLYDHLSSAHHFIIDPRRTVFAGLCETCAGEEAPHGAQ